MITSGGCFFLCQDAKHQNTLRLLHAMGSLFDGKYSQWGNRFLPITEAYLEHSQKSTMKIFAKIVNGLQPLIIFAKSLIVNSDWVLDTPPYYLLCKVQCQQNDLQSFFSVKLIKKMLPCYTTTIAPQSKGINWTTEQHKSGNSVGF